jgi:TP901 family phage tail tape measure protein
MAEINLQSYYIFIGYKIDEESSRKYKENLRDTRNKIIALAEATVATAVKMVSNLNNIINTVNDLYITSQKTDTPVKNLEALEYAFKKVGFEAKNADSALIQISSGLRGPGFEALIRGFGFAVSKDNVQNLFNVLEGLKKEAALSPAFAMIAAGKAQTVLGIDEPTFHALIQNLDDLKKAYIEQQKVSPYSEARAKQIHEAAMRVEELKEKWQNFITLTTDKLIPILEKVMYWLEEFINWIVKLHDETGGWSSAIIAIAVALGGLAEAISPIVISLALLSGGFSAASASAIAAASAFGTFVLAATALAGIAASGYFMKKAWDFTQLEGDDREKMHLHRLELLKGQGRLAKEDEPVLEALTRKYKGTQAQPGSRQSIHDFIRQKAQEMGIDPNLAAALAHQESGFNPFAISKAGAMGIMQLMPKTAAGLGVTNPFDIEQNVTGGLKYLKQMLALYPGHEELAVAAYNAGPGAVHGKIPNIPETQDYVKRVEQYKLGEQKGAQVTLSQKTEINVNGAGDPKAVADHVLGGQDDVNADLFRYTLNFGNQ